MQRMRGTIGGNRPLRRDQRLRDGLPRQRPPRSERAITAKRVLAMGLEIEQGQQVL